MNVLAGLLTTLLLLQTPTPRATTGRIAGRITIEGTTAPIASARVMLFQVNGGRSGPPGPPAQTTTDTDGRFSFDRLTPGAYRIDVQKSGFAPLNGPGLPARAPIQLAAGQSIESLDLHLQRGGVISGKVLDAAGEPLPDVSIMALRRVPLGRSSGQSRLMPAGGPGGQTNDLGEFRLAGLAPGEYYVAASPRMGSPFGGPSAAADNTTKRTTTTTTFYPGTMDDVTAQAITVTAGNEFNNVVFTIQTVPAFRIFGIVVDDNGAPVAGAMVMLMRDPRAGIFFAMGGGGSATSGADGRFVISDVAAGTYRLNASMPMRPPAAGLGGGTFGFVTSGLVSGPAIEQPNEVVVTDSDVKGARVTVRRPPQ